MGRASRCHGPPWSPRAGHRPSAASSPPCWIPFLNTHLMRTAPGPAPPAATPDSNNCVDPSPYYPVFGRRMVMIGYARRLPNPANRHARALCGAHLVPSNMTCRAWSPSRAARASALAEVSRPVRRPWSRWAVAGPGVPLTAVIAGHPGAWHPRAGRFAGYAPVSRCRGRAGCMIGGHRRRISPQTTRNHECARRSAPANRGVTVKSAGSWGPFAAMTRDQRRLAQTHRTRRAAEPSARSATGTPNAVQVFEKTERPWRCRESNPSPPGPFQVFSERSLLCFS
jgi:hypothetical protein